MASAEVVFGLTFASYDMLDFYICDVFSSFEAFCRSKFVAEYYFKD